MMITTVLSGFLQQAIQILQVYILIDARQYSDHGTNKRDEVAAI